MLSSRMYMCDRCYCGERDTSGKEDLRAVLMQVGGGVREMDLTSTLHVRSASMCFWINSGQYCSNSSKMRRQLLFWVSSALPDNMTRLSSLRGVLPQRSFGLISRSSCLYMRTSTSQHCTCTELQELRLKLPHLIMRQCGCKMQWGSHVVVPCVF